MILGEYLDKLLALCADAFGVSVEEVRSPSRKQELVYCRKAFCIIVKETLDVKHEVIGRKINRSDNRVSVSISKQPADNYYRMCLSRIRVAVKSVSFT